MILAVLLILIFGIDIFTHVQLPGVSIFLIGWVISVMYGYPLFLVYQERQLDIRLRDLKFTLKLVKNK